MLKTIYKINNDVKNLTNLVKQHPVIATNQSYRLREFEILQESSQAIKIETVAAIITGGIIVLLNIEK